MMGQCVSNPILDHVWFLLEDSKASGSVIGMVSNLHLQGSSLPHYLQIIRLKSECVLEALGSLQEIFPLLVDSAASMPTEKTLHFALQ